MKKIILFIFSFIAIFISSFSFAVEKCNFDTSENLATELKTCIEDGNYGGVKTPDNLDLTSGTGFSESIKKWSEKIAILVGSLAIFMLVYASFLLVVSQGEEEKVKKAKDIIKWVILGFIGLISAGLIVMLVVKLGYFFGQV